MTEGQWIDEFAENLSCKLSEYGCTQREFAEDCGLAESTISRYLRGQAVPTIFALINMSHVLGCSIDELADFGAKIR